MWKATAVLVLRYGAVYAAGGVLGLGVLLWYRYRGRNQQADCESSGTP